MVYAWESPSEDHVLKEKYSNIVLSQERVLIVSSERKLKKINYVLCHTVTSCLTGSSGFLNNDCFCGCCSVTPLKLCDGDWSEGHVDVHEDGARPPFLSSAVLFPSGSRDLAASVFSIIVSLLQMKILELSLWSIYSLEMKGLKLCPYRWKHTRSTGDTTVGRSPRPNDGLQTSTLSSFSLLTQSAGTRRRVRQVTAGPIISHPQVLGVFYVFLFTVFSQKLRLISSLLFIKSFVSTGWSIGGDGRASHDSFRELSHVFMKEWWDVWLGAVKSALLLS